MKWFALMSIFGKSKKRRTRRYKKSIHLNKTRKRKLRGG
jgi:hypothetical protein